MAADDAGRPIPVGGAIVKPRAPKKVPPIGKVRAVLRQALRSKNFKMVDACATFFKKGQLPCDFHAMKLLAECFEAMGQKENAKWCNVLAQQAKAQNGIDADSVAKRSTPAKPKSNERLSSPLTPPREEPNAQGETDMDVDTEEDTEIEEALDSVDYVSRLQNRLRKPNMTEELLFPKLEKVDFERFENRSRMEMTVKLRIPLLISEWSDKLGFNLLAHGKSQMTRKDIQGGDRAFLNARNRAAKHALEKIAGMREKVEDEATRKLRASLDKWFAGLRREMYVEKCYQAFKRARDIIFSSTHVGLYSAKVFLYGSASTGLVLGDSDIDVAVALPISKSHESPRDAHADILAFLRKAVENSMSDVELIPKAKVPVLRYYDQEAKVDVDITIANDKSVLLSRLLRNHLKCDVRIWELCMAVKYWARRRRISGTPLGHINPMGWIIMVIYFLQHHVTPRIGNLFKTNGNDSAHAVIRSVPWSTQKGCGRSLANTGELLTQFFELFGYRFDFANEAISINTQRPEKTQSLSGRRYGGAIFIEQPLEPGANVVDYMKATTLDIVVTELRRGYGICKTTGDGASLFKDRQKTEEDYLFSR